MCQLQAWGQCWAVAGWHSLPAPVSSQCIQQLGKGISWVVLWCFGCEPCCLAIRVALLFHYALFMATFVCLQNTEKKKKKKKKMRVEGEDWWGPGKTLALGQLLWSSISQHDLFSLLLKTNFPVLQEGKEMGLIAVFSLEQDTLVSLIIRRITGFFCLKIHNRSSFHNQSPLIRNKNIFMEILCLCLLTCLLVF